MWSSLKKSPSGKSKGSKVLYCSFCGRSSEVVEKLIAGPKVHICDECVWRCNAILESSLDAEGIGRIKSPPGPAVS